LFGWGFQQGMAVVVEYSGGESTASYVVVARRYRPQTFQQLVGQNQVAQALSNAIETHRVGHAYLFTGARGVGKTSTARIFAKCLNCQTGPTTQPCDRCDLCEAISTGEDVDVLEIDGASNRGIDEIRQLRSFASVRPSRSRYKIYIIDEVHMLTKEAFNALLKTLEEPPPHVKFIFCTTNPEKIPITVLSRCQRFDFTPVVADEIKARLQFIVAAEGAEAEEDALTLLARRAGGSMRDSQSLLEQLLSFSSGKITVQAVHQMLGTAPGGRVETLVQAIADSHAARALEEIHAAICEGADVGQVLEQLNGYFRDLLILSVGSSPEVLLQLGPDQVAAGRTWALSMGTTRILATLQIFDWALARMRQSTQVRCLLEIAVVQAAGLAALTPLATAIDAVGRLSGASGSAGRGQVTPVAAIPTSASSSAAGTATGGTAGTATGGTAGKKTAAEKKNEPIAESAPALPTRMSPAAALPSTAAPASKNAASAVANAAPAVVADLRPASSSDPCSDNPLGGVCAPEPAAARDTDAPAAGASIAAVDQAAREPLGSAAATPLQQYQQAFQGVDGMIRELATSCSQVEVLGNSHWRVVMENQYLADLCQRPDRRSQIEKALEESTGRRIRIDFTFRPEPDSHLAAAPKPNNKTQALRDLQSSPYVARLNELFSAEWTELLPPRPRKA
jgi:DNA polymerase-3 subunit gamma/tau